MKCRIGILCATLLLASAFAAAEEPAKTPAPPSKKELEKKFHETLSGVTLTGHFTSGNGDLASAKEEKYGIESVTKLPGDGDLWLFKARIQYGKHDVAASRCCRERGLGRRHAGNYVGQISRARLRAVHRPGEDFRR